MGQSSKAADLLLWIGAPIVLVFGLFGNVVIYGVIQSYKSRFLTFSMYFQALTITDTFLLLFRLLPEWVSSFIPQEHVDVKGHWICRVQGWFHFAAFSCSSWFLASMVAQRAVGVVKPHVSRGKTSVIICKVIIALIVIVSCALSSVPLFREDVMSESNCYFGSQEHFKHNETGRIMAWIEFANVFLLPFSVIVASNVVLGVSLASHQKALDKHTSTVQRQVSTISIHDRAACACLSQCWSRIAANSITCTMMITSMAFCLLLGPQYLTEALLDQEVISQDSISPVVQEFFDLLEYSNAGINFYLYCLSGKHFRLSAQIYITDHCCCCCKDKINMRTTNNVRNATMTMFKLESVPMEHSKDNYFSNDWSKSEEMHLESKVNDTDKARIDVSSMDKVRFSCPQSPSPGLKSKANDTTGRPDSTPSPDTAVDSKTNDTTSWSESTPVLTTEDTTTGSDNELVSVVSREFLSNLSQDSLPFGSRI